MKFSLAHAEISHWAIEVGLTRLYRRIVRVRVLHPIDNLRPVFVLAMSSQLPCPRT